MASNSTNEGSHVQMTSTNAQLFSLLAWNDALPVVLISVSIVYCAVRLMHKLCVAKLPSAPNSADDHRMTILSVVSDPNSNSIANHNWTRIQGLIMMCLLAQVLSDPDLLHPTSMIQTSLLQYQRLDHAREESLSQSLSAGPTQSGVSVFFG